MAMEINDIVGGRGGFGFSGGDSGIGLIALLAATGALGNNRRNDCDRDRDCVDNATLNSALNSVQETITTSAVLGKLASIEAAVPYNEAQMQLALGQAVASLTQQNANNTQFLSTQNVQLASQAATNAALTARDIAAVDTNVDRQSTAIQVAIKDSERNILEVINQNRIKDLEQQLTVSQLRESECRAINREQENSHNVTVQVNQQQAQSQLQFQAVNHALTALCNGVSQVAQATNSQVVVGSTGVVGGAQTANPSNVNM